MNKENIKQYVIKKRGISSPENRGALLIGGTLLLFLSLAGYAAYETLKSENPVQVSTGKVDASKVSVEANAKTSRAYKEAKRQENLERYNEAGKREGGMAIPFTFNEEPQGGEPGKDIENCGCTLNDDQLMSAIKRLGISGTKTSERDYMRLEKSDIYIATNGQLMGAYGEALAFRTNAIFMQANGQLIDSNEIAFLSKDKQPLYLGGSGNVMDQQARSVPLHGDLLTKSGALIIGDGRLATRPGNMQKVGRSDIYITKEGQLATMNGKPIRHSGAYTFQNDEGQLISKDGINVAWEKQAVYQSKKGKLVNVSGKKFTQPGILFSFEGILINNDGLLTRPLVDIERVGDSDIYITKDNVLIDNYGLPITHYGVKVRTGPSNKLLSSSGKAIRNKNGSDVYFSKNGVLRVDIGKGGIQSGLLKTSEGVALNQQGQLITRRGRLEQRGKSDIYLTSDGLLSDKDGKAVRSNSKDTFLDFTATLADGSQGLETHDLVNVTDNDGKRVYLTLSGKLVDRLGRSIKNSGVLSLSDGTLITPSGKKVIQSSGMEQVTTTSGQPVTYLGEDVFKGKDGQLFGADGSPVLTPEGRAVFMDGNGNLVDENGNLIENVELMAGQRVVKNGELTTRSELTTPSHEKIFHNGEEVYLDDQNRVVDANGNPILTKDGRSIYADAEGNLIDEDGNIIKESLLKTESGENIAFGLIAGRKQAITKDGSPVKYKGRNVFKMEDGALIDADGNPIFTRDGRKVYMNEEGQLVDEKGNLVTDELLTAGGSPVKNGEFVSTPSSDMKRVGDSEIFATRDGTLLDKDGKAITYNDKKVRVGKNGQLFDENGAPVLDKRGRPVFMNKKGEITNKKGSLIGDSILESGDGVLINSEGKLATSDMSKVGDSDIYKGEGGRLLSKTGKAIKFNGKNVYVGKNGRLFYENGKPVTDKNGSSVFLDSVTGELVDRNEQAIAGNILTDSEGVLIDASGELITSGGKLKRIPGTALFQTADGQVVDGKGNPVLVHGNPVFVDSSGKIINKYGKTLRFKGQEQFISSEGWLVDNNGQPMLDSEKRSVRLSEDGGIINEDGESVSKTGEANDKKAVAQAGHGFKKTVWPDKKSQAKVGPKIKNTAPKSSASEAASIPDKPAYMNDKIKGKSNVGEVSTSEEKPSAYFDLAGAERLQRRYATIKMSMQNQLTTVKQTDNRDLGQGFVAVGGAMPAAEKTIIKEPGKDVGSSDGEDTQVVFKKAGEVLYAATSYQINSDYIKEIVVEIVDLHPKHQLYKSKAFGRFELVYDQIVLTFDKICPSNSPCIPMEGVALNPDTSAAALASNVNHHYWYRYGGLFLSSLLEGVSGAVGESAVREETITPTGTKTTSSGISGDKLVLRSFGRVGETFSEVLANNITRPVTVRVEPGEEMIIMLFDDIKGATNE